MVKIENGVVTLEYHVDHDVPFTRPEMVMFQGKEIEAPVPARQVHLIPTERANTMGSFTLRFLGSEINEVAGIFEVDGDVEITIRKLRGASPVEQPAVDQPVEEAAPAA